LRRDVDVLLHGGSGAHSCKQRTRLPPAAAWGFCARHGSALAHGTGRRIKWRARSAIPRDAVARGCEMVHVCRQLHGSSQTDGRAAASRDHRCLAALWRVAAVHHSGSNRLLYSIPGWRGAWLARLCPAAIGGALWARSRKPPAWADLGRLASAAIFYSGCRHLQAVILRVRLTVNRDFRGLGLAVGAHQRKPAAHHADARRGE